MRPILLSGVILCAATCAAAQPPKPTQEQITVRAKRLLLKEKNSPSAVTELGRKQIAQEGTLGSTATLLRQAPSIYVYQTGPGENAPVFSIRGTRALEVAATLDDIPMQDLLVGGTTAFVGNRFTLDQIDGVTIYPGVAYPDRNTFGTIGGTLAYTSKRPDPDFGVDVTGSAGSFDTYSYGVEINSGAIDGPLGNGENAPRVLLNYQNLASRGYIEHTPARYNSFEFAADKPYDDGLSKFQATLLYNTGAGAVLVEPTPIPLLVSQGRFANYGPTQLTQSEQNDFLTIYLKDQTYVNDWLNLGIAAFYRNSNSQTENWESPEVASNGYPPNIYPLVNVPYNFQSNSNFGIGPGYYWLPGYLNYDPARYYNDPKLCPADLLGYGGPCGLNAQLDRAHTDSYGIEPRVTLLLPLNTIKFGGLIAKETEPTPQSFIGGTPGVTPQPGVNQFQLNGYGGGAQRTIFQFFAQDKIDLLSNTLHITPGFTLEDAFSSNHAHDFFIINAAGTVDTIPSFKLHKYDREYLPFVNVSYDLDRAVPALAGAALYASFGNSALFAPVTDFTPATTGGVPYASIVHMYEAGFKYDTQRLLFSADWFYQKVDRDFGFYAGSGNTQGQNFYGNSGQREFKGVESAIVWQVTPRWQFFANGSYVNAKYLATNPAYSTIGEDQYGLALKDTPISGVPAFLANIGLDYDAKSVLRENDRFSARFASQFTGPQYQTYDLSNTQIVPPYPPSQTQGDTVTDLHHHLPAFTVYNLLLSYTLPTPHLGPKELKFDLNIQNLFDRRYWQYYYSQIPPINGIYDGPAYSDGLPGPPFSITFAVTGRF